MTVDNDGRLVKIKKETASDAKESASNAKNAVLDGVVLFATFKSTWAV